MESSVPVYNLCIAAVTISAIGVGTNTMSIIYFIKKERQGLPNKPMISLNLCDILTLLMNIQCNFFIIRFLNLYIYSIDQYRPLYIMYNPYCCLSVTSGCVTFGITLLRTIAIFKPLYHIKPKFPICGLMTMIITFSTLLVVKSLWIRPSDKLGGILIVILPGLNIIMSISAIVAL